MSLFGNKKITINNRQFLRNSNVMNSQIKTSFFLMLLNLPIKQINLYIQMK